MSNLSSSLKTSLINGLGKDNKTSFFYLITKLWEIYNRSDLLLSRTPKQISFPKEEIPEDINILELKNITFSIWLNNKTYEGSFFKKIDETTTSIIVETTEIITKTLLCIPKTIELNNQNILRALELLFEYRTKKLEENTEID